MKDEEGSSGIEAREGGSFQIKHPSPPYLMHYTNSAYRINDIMTPKQCPHNVQPTLPLPVKQQRDKYLRKDQRPSKWKAGMQSKQLYMGRKILMEGGIEKLGEREREREREREIEL